jgi:hypothetical protein
VSQGKAVLGKDKQPCVINLKMCLLAPCDKGSPGATVPSHAASAPGVAAEKKGEERDRNWEVCIVPPLTRILLFYNTGDDTGVVSCVRRRVRCLVLRCAIHKHTRPCSYTCAQAFDKLTHDLAAAERELAMHKSAEEAKTRELSEAAATLQALCRVVCNRDAEGSLGGVGVAVVQEGTKTVTKGKVASSVIRIHQIFRLGPAAKDGVLCVGDMIVRVLLPHLLVAPRASTL